MMWLISILKFTPVGFLGTLQRPTLLLVLSNWVANTLRVKKIDERLLVLLCLCTINMLVSITIYPAAQALRSYANFMLALIFLAFFSRRRKIRFLHSGLMVQQILLIIDVVLFFNGSVILKGITSNPTKYFPSGLTPEPSDAVVLMILHLIILVRARRKFIALLVFCTLCWYSIYFSVETFYFLGLAYLLGLIYFWILKRNYFSYFLMIGICFLVTYYQFYLFDYSLFNDSAHNRFTTPTYFINAATELKHILWGHGFGGVAMNYEAVVTVNSLKFNTPLSVEQKDILKNGVISNFSLFNFYARILYEQGLIGSFLFFSYAYRAVYKRYSRSSIPLVLALWFVSDIGINPFFLVR